MKDNNLNKSLFKESNNTYDNSNPTMLTQRFTLMNRIKSSINFNLNKYKPEQKTGFVNNQNCSKFYNNNINNNKISIAKVIKLNINDNEKNIDNINIQSDIHNIDNSSLERTNKIDKIKVKKSPRKLKQGKSPKLKEKNRKI